MSDFNSNKYEKIDEVFSYISPDAIEEHGVEFVIPLIHLSQVALSAFHPDSATEIKEKEIGALSEVNALVKLLENNEDNINDTIYNQSIELTHEARDYLRIINKMSKSLTELKSQIITPHLNISDHSNSYKNFEIVATGEELDEDSKIFSLIFGSKVISLLSKTTIENQRSALTLVKKKIRNLSEYPAGIEMSRWNHLLDQIIYGDLHMDYQEIIPKNDELIASVDLIPIGRLDIEEKLRSLQLELMPGSKNEFPEKWLRSFTGTLVAPSQASTWKMPIIGYDYKMGEIEILELENGSVNNHVIVDPDRRENIQLVEDLDNNTKVFIKSVISSAADLLGYNSGEFIKILRSNNLSNETDIRMPMDFIFRINNEGKAELVYSVVKSENSFDKKIYSDVDVDLGQSLDLCLDPGYYMIKAGKNQKTGKYRLKNTPLALIKLDVTNDNTANELIGSALFCSISDSGGKYDDDSVNGIIDLEKCYVESIYDDYALEKHDFSLLPQQGDSVKYSCENMSRLLFHEIQMNNENQTNTPPVSLESMFELDSSSAEAYSLIFIDGKGINTLKSKINSYGFVFISKS